MLNIIFQSSGLSPESYAVLNPPLVVQKAVRGGIAEAYDFDDNICKALCVYYDRIEGPNPGQRIPEPL